MGKFELTYASIHIKFGTHDMLAISPRKPKFILIVQSKAFRQYNVLVIFSVHLVFSDFYRCDFLRTFSANTTRTNKTVGLSVIFRYRRIEI